MIVKKTCSFGVLLFLVEIIRIVQVTSEGAVNNAYIKENFLTSQIVDEDIANANNEQEQHLNTYWAQIIQNPQTLKIATNSTKSTNKLLVQAAAELGLFLQKFTELELGTKEVTTAYEAVSFDARQEISPLEQAKDLANKMTSEMKIYQDALERMVSAVKSSYGSEWQTTTIPFCCDLTEQQFRYYEDYKSAVSKLSSCWTMPPRNRKGLFIPGKEFNEVLLSNYEAIPHLKWQYFISPDGVQIQYPSVKQNCPIKNGNFTPSFTSVLTGKSSSEKKPWLMQKPRSDTQIHRIIFLIQLDSNATAAMIKSIKNIVFRLLKLLDEADEVGIINSEPDQLWSNFICDQMLRTSSWTRFQIINYLNYLENRYKASNMSLSNYGSTSTKPDHYLGLEKAIAMACQNSSESSTMFPPCATTIIQLSTSAIDIKKFAARTISVKCPIFIESFFLQPYNSSEEELFRKTMQNVASKNIWRVQVFSLEHIDPETFADKVAMQLNTKKEWWSLSDILSQFFPQGNSSQNLREFSLPIWNQVSRELVIVAKRFVFHQDRPLGLVSIEAPLLILTQHIVSFHNENVVDSRNYVFLIDKNGRVVIHPSFGKPDLSKGAFYSVPIEQVEVYHGFLTLKKRIINEETGCGSLHSKKENVWVTYAWASSLNYIVVLTFFGKSGGCGSENYEFVLRKNALSTSEIQYHLLLEKTLCCNNQLISVNKGGLYLSQSAFRRPADILNYDTSWQHSKRLLALMAYIGDHSGMIQNPTGDLKSSTKYHIGVLAPSIPLWKQRYFQSDWNKYILRRYSTAGGGTFLLIYPGVQISLGYNIQTSEWYRKAIDGQGKVIFLPPMFDPQVKLPLVTMAQVINLNLSTPFSQTMYSTSVAVAAADLHAGFLQKLIEDLLPDCRNKSTNRTKNDVPIRCFLVDENGFAIYHPHLVGSYHANSNVHITQLEPLSVMDILQQSPNSQELLYLNKFMCHKVSEASMTQGSLKRMYKFAMGAEGIHKLKNGEVCNLYFLLPVPQTNLFLGVVKDSCSSATAFCPCSRVDNLCLNCLRMEQSDCECPCECPREPSFCVRKSFIDLPEDVVPCEFPFESLPMVRVETNEKCYDKTPTNTTLSCDYLKTSCSSISQPNMCTGSWGCQWCLLLNSTSSSNYSCAKYSECYDAVNEELLDRVDSFLGEDSSIVNKENDLTINDSQLSLLPVLGVLAVFMVFIALVSYCYRQRGLTISESQPDLHLLPLQDNQIELASPIAEHRNPNESDSESDSMQLHVPIINHRNSRRNVHEELPPPRSPVASTVSDLGYSTMTGENISECGASARLVYLEPPPKPRRSIDRSGLEHCRTRTIGQSKECTLSPSLAPVSVLVHAQTTDDT